MFRRADLKRRALLLVTVTGLSGCAGLIGDINPILKAVVSEKPQKVQRAVDASPDDINEVNVCGASALHLAIQNSSVEIVRILLQAGADPNIYSAAAAEPSPCSDYFLVAVPPGYPPLHYAIYAARPHIAEVLFAAGADPLLKTASGATAIDLARDRVGLEALLADMQSVVQHTSSKDY